MGREREREHERVIAEESGKKRIRERERGN